MTEDERRAIWKKIWDRQPVIKQLRRELEEELEKDRADIMLIKQDCEGKAL